MKMLMVTDRIRMCLGLVMIAALAFSGAVMAQSDLGRADGDGNGKVDYEEFRAHMVDTFYQADRSRDGKLGGEELEVLSADRIPDADKNGDGGLDLKEFLNSTGADFRAADKNRNHLLEPNEL